MFKKAERKQSKLRLALSGASGSGKTIGALMIAKGLGGSIAVLDTENGSASLYADMFDFDVVNLAPPFNPERFIEVIKAAEKAGYDTLIIDSSTHEWSGTGGCLEIVDNLAKAKFRGNSWSAWSEVTPRHRAFVDAMLQSKMHIITTMRSKTETAQVEVNGKKQVQKLGMKTEQRDGIEYEFTVCLDLVHDSNYAMVSKDRTQLFANEPQRISVDTGVMLLEWLNSAKSEILDTPTPPLKVVETKTEVKEPVQESPKPKVDMIALLRSITNALNLDALKQVAANIPTDGLSDKDKESINRAYAKRKAELQPLSQEKIDEIAKIMQMAVTQEQLDQTWKYKVDEYVKVITQEHYDHLSNIYQDCLNDITQAA